MQYTNTMLGPQTGGYFWRRSAYGGVEHPPSPTLHAAKHLSARNESRDFSVPILCANDPRTPRSVGCLQR